MLVQQTASLFLHRSNVAQSIETLLDSAIVFLVGVSVLLHPAVLDMLRTAFAPASPMLRQQTSSNSAVVISSIAQRIVASVFQMVVLLHQIVSVAVDSLVQQHSLLRYPFNVLAFRTPMLLRAQRFAAASISMEDFAVVFHQDRLAL